MATHYLRGESVPVILPHNLSAAAAFLAQFDRKAVGTAVEVLVGLLDVTDEDPDLETCRAEDDFTTLPKGIDYGPGCEISDCGEDDDPDHEHDGREEGYGV